MPRDLPRDMSRDMHSIIIITRNHHMPATITPPSEFAGGAAGRRGSSPERVRQAWKFRAMIPRRGILL